jgi:hypothetical protein
MFAVPAGHWPWTVDYGFAIPALVSPGSVRRHCAMATMVRTDETGFELPASGKSGLW